tara:strand:- start:2171 stop:2311 length:141 start_codon:yes stop_codon:yes gene_type:complete
MGFMEMWETSISTMIRFLPIETSIETTYVSEKIETSFITEPKEMLE